MEPESKLYEALCIHCGLPQSRHETVMAWCPSTSTTFKAALAAHEEGGGMRVCNRPGCGNGPLDDVCEVCRAKDALASQEPPAAPAERMHHIWCKSLLKMDLACNCGFPIVGGR